MANKLKTFVFDKEPVAVFTVFGGSILTFVTEAQGSLHGRDAWVAVGVAGAAWLLRHFVSPAAKVAEAESVSKDAEELADRLEKLEEQMRFLVSIDDNWNG